MNEKLKPPQDYEEGSRNIPDPVNDNLDDFERSKFKPNPLLGCLFKEAAYKYFSPEDEESAQEYIDIKNRVDALNYEGRIEISEAMHNFVHGLTPEQDVILRQANIPHLFYGSSQNVKDWRRSKLFTADGKFEHFLKAVVLPRLLELEK